MRLLNTVRPTHHQKLVMAIVATAATPKAAIDRILGNTQLVAARDMLAKLGAVTFAGDHIDLTDAGMQLARDEALIDDAGQPTPNAEQIVNGAQSQSPAAPIPTQSPEIDDFAAPINPGLGS